VAPLPTNLQDYLAAFLEQKAGKDDLADFLSQDHLQFLYSRFLGSRKGKQGKDIQHSLWSKVNEIIRRDSDVNPIQMAPPGLSLTINEYLRQHATGIKNIWQGNIYSKCLDYLTRILLRLHLAPSREGRYIEKKKEYRSKKADRGASTRDLKPLTMKLWTWRAKRLTDQLAGAIQKKDSHRISLILGRLSELKKIEPLGRAESKRQFISLEEQLSQSEESPSVSEELGDILDTIEGDALEEMDEDDFKEFEDSQVEEEQEVSNI
jgi:hypothetical protein